MSNFSGLILVSITHRGWTRLIFSSAWVTVLIPFFPFSPLSEFTFVAKPKSSSSKIFRSDANETLYGELLFNYRFKIKFRIDGNVKEHMNGRFREHSSSISGDLNCRLSQELLSPYPKKGWSCESIQCVFSTGANQPIRQTMDSV